MRTRRATTIRDLRTAIDSLPVATRQAMLRGVGENTIVVGAYTHDGGTCPMLAAHRAGGRTDCIAFARAWDRFTLGTGRAARTARPATDRELGVLVSHLEASLLAATAPRLTASAPDGTLTMAIAAHTELVRTRRAREAARERPAPTPARRSRSDAREPGSRPGDANRARELAARDGWAWTRPARTFADYERYRAGALAQRPDARLAAPEDGLRPPTGRCMATA